MSAMLRSLDLILDAIERYQKILQKKKSSTDVVVKICLASVWGTLESGTRQEEERIFFSDPVGRNGHISNIFRKYMSSFLI